MPRHRGHVEVARNRLARGKQARRIIAYAVECPARLTAVIPIPPNAGDYFMLEWPSL